MMRKKLTMIGTKFWLHFVLWFLLITSEVLFLRYVYHGPWPGALHACYYCLNIASFYFFSSLLSGLGGRPKAVKVIRVLLILLVLLVSCLLKAGIDYLRWTGNPVQRMAEVKRYLAADLTRSFYFLLLAIFYQVATYLTMYRKRAADAHAAFLSQQLQPHMLLNSLNFVYSTVEAYSEEAARGVWLISELMRFAVEPAGADGLVSVEAEFAQLRHLAEINQLRFGGVLRFSLSAEGDLVPAWVIPLVLLTLTENIFKHGDLSREAFVRVSVSGGRLFYHSANAVRPVLQERRSVGLENLRVRLAHAYGRRYSLVTKVSADCFEVFLEMPCGS